MNNHKIEEEYWATYQKEDGTKIDGYRIKCSCGLIFDDWDDDSCKLQYDEHLTEVTFDERN